MANEREVYDTALAGFQAAYIEEEAAYRKAELTGDFAEQTRAFQAMGAHRAAMMGCHTIATDHVASMQRQTAQPRNKFGLSDEEVSIARKAFTPPDDVPPNQVDEYMERSYAQKKQLLREKRASGEYRQTTDQTG